VTLRVRNLVLGLVVALPHGFERFRGGSNVVG
jgi:hypothetical protein